MSRTRTVAVALARGVAFHTAFSAVTLGALSLWAHHCEGRRRRQATRAAEG